MNHELAGLENLSFNSTSNYKVKNELARGGMGIIFLAEKNTGGVFDQVVLKSLRTFNPEEEEKLRQEASIATMLRHENIVKTYGLESVPLMKLPKEMQSLLVQESKEEEETTKGSFFSRLTSKTTRMKKPIEKNLLLLIMDYIKGTDFYTMLVNHLKENLLFPTSLSAFIISRIAGALSYAHTYIVHRDISPENILISEQGVCKLTDFGVAVVAHQQPEYWAGKLMYMAPEQIRNDPIDERADIFALGLVAYQAITGIPLLFAPSDMPFEDQVRLVYSQMEKSFVPPHLVCKDVPIELSRIISKMLALAPEYRYQRASSVVADLEKDYLYAKGFGPTNNSLASYIDIFNSGFQQYDEVQLQQLSFLKDENGQLALKRTLDVNLYTKAGQRLLAERKGCRIVNQLRKIHKERKKQMTEEVKRIDKIPVVKVKYLDNVVEAFALEEGDFLPVGRSTQNTVVIPDKIVSGQHARFYMAKGVAIVEDINSHNGTRVNGEKIQRAKLKEGDKIQIGSTLIYFLWEEKKSPPSKVYTVDGFNTAALKEPEITLQFLPNDETLGSLNGIVEEVMKNTPLGIMKRNVITPAIYEAIRVFTGEVAESPTQLKIVRSNKSVSFRCYSAPESYGYEAFLSAVFRRMDNELDSKSSLEPEELAISLILKVFERIEMMRFSREIVLSNFF